MWRSRWSRRIRLEPALLPTVVGLVAGALVVGVLLAVVGSRARMGIRLGLLGLILGGAVGAILGSVTFDTKGACAVALTTGSSTWIAVAALLAARHGFDPEARYRRLVPRESIAMAGQSKAVLERELRRQRKRVVGR